MDICEDRRGNDSFADRCDVLRFVVDVGNVDSKRIDKIVLYLPADHCEVRRSRDPKPGDS